MLHPPFPIIISLGSNLGERREALEMACQLLDQSGVRVVRRSRLYWTRPWGVTDQPEFLNAAVAVWTRCSPREVLWRCLKIEQMMGRKRIRRWGERRIDLDLILYGNARIRTPELTLPHPGIGGRDFVMAPLLDLQAPPVHAVAPGGWRAAIARLPKEERTILRSEPWK